jgi:hypothetical protein
MSGRLLGRSGSDAAGLVVAVGVEDQGAEESAGVAVDDSDVEVGDEHQDLRAGESPSEADVVQPGVVADGDAAGLVDGVGADPPVRVDDDAVGGCLGPAA